MSDRNHVEIEGVLSKDAVLRTGKTTGISFSICYNKRVKLNDGTVTDDPMFFDVIYWGKDSEAKCAVMKTGTTVCVIGELNQVHWEKDGKTNHKVQIDAKVVNIPMKFKASNNTDKQTSPAGEDDCVIIKASDDEIDV